MVFILPSGLGNFTVENPGSGIICSATGMKGFRLKVLNDSTENS